MGKKSFDFSKQGIQVLKKKKSEETSGFAT